MAEFRSTPSKRQEGLIEVEDLRNGSLRYLGDPGTTFSRCYYVRVGAARKGKATQTDDDRRREPGVKRWEGNLTITSRWVTTGPGPMKAQDAGQNFFRFRRSHSSEEANR